MKTADTKTTAAQQQRQHNHQPFFNHEGEGAFFAPEGTESAHDNGLINNSSVTTPFFQPKLKVGQPGDRYEREADTMADQVVEQLTQPDSQVKGKAFSLNGSQGGIQSQQEPEEELQTQEEDTLQRKPIFESESEDAVQAKPDFSEAGQGTLQASWTGEGPVNATSTATVSAPEEVQRQEEEGDQEEQEEEIQRKPIFESEADPTEDTVQQQPLMAKAGNGDLTAGPELESGLEASRGGGEPLPEDTRSSMESAFGADFSGVRVHNDAAAADMNEGLGAQAFTHGNDIYFNEGKYDPENEDGQRLLAHELTHTVQQGSAPSAVQKQEGESSSGPPTRPTTPIDIRDRFAADEAWAAYLESQRRDIEVPVKIGNDYQGTITVRRRSRRATENRAGQYGLATRGVHYLDAQGMEFLNPLRNAGVYPILVLNQFGEEGQTTGFLSVRIGNRAIGNVLGVVRGFNDNMEAMSFLGLDELQVREPNINNTFENGRLVFEVRELTTVIDGFLRAGGGFGIVGGNFTFNINADVDIAGLASGEFTLSRQENGQLSGRATIEASIANVDATVTVEYEAGAVTIQGTGRIQSEKFSGSITLLVTDRARSRQMMHAALGIESMEQEADNAEQPAAPKTPQNQVLVGWGEVTATITPWLEGTAKVGIDAEGHVTIVGEIEVTEEVELMEQRGRRIQIFEVEIRAGYGIPLVGQVFLFASIGMFINAGFGPLVLRDIRFEGTYSTDPSVLQQFMITGTLSINAFAILGLEAEAGVGVTLLGHDVKAGVNVTAAAGIRAYALATPTFEYAEQASPEGGKVGEAHLRGHFEAAAQLFLMLSGALFVELDSPWWSPAPDGREETPLGEVQYPIGDSLGIGADVDWLVGSDQIPELEFSPVEFDADQFTADIMAEPPPRRLGNDEERPEGDWEDGTQRGNLDEQPQAQEGGEGLPRSRENEENLRNLPDEQRYMRGLGEISDIAELRQRPTVSVVESKINRIKRKYNLDQVRIQEENDDNVMIFVRHARQDNSNHLVRVPVMSEAERVQLLHTAMEDLTNRMNRQAGEAGTLSQSEANSLATAWKEEHTIIEDVSVVDGGDSWDFRVDIGDRNRNVPGKGKTEAAEEQPTDPEQEQEAPEEGVAEEFQIIGLQERVNVDGGHTVIIEGSIDRAEIIVRTRRIGLNQLLRLKQEEIHRLRGEGANVSDKQQSLDTITSEKRTFGRSVATYRSAVRRVYEGGGNTAVQNAYNQIRSSIQIIASNLEVIGVNIEEVDLPETRVLHTQENGKAKRVIAQPLSKTPGNTRGSSPGQNPEGWDKIPPDERRSGWVRAHLLNHQLHGPGVKWNLFPGRGRLNTAQMENEVESPAKRMVWRENKVLYYNVVLVYGNTGELKPFPTEVHMEFGEFDHENNRRASSPTVRTVFTQEPPEVLHAVNINQDSASRLKETATANGIRGVGGLIDKIVRERVNGTFLDLSDIEDRLEGYYSNQTSFERAFSKLETLIRVLKVISI